MESGILHSVFKVNTKETALFSTNENRYFFTSNIANRPHCHSLDSKLDWGDMGDKTIFLKHHLWLNDSHRRLKAGRVPAETYLHVFWCLWWRMPSKLDWWSDPNTAVLIFMYGSLRRDVRILSHPLTGTFREIPTLQKSVFISNFAGKRPTGTRDYCLVFIIYVWRWEGKKKLKVLCLTVSEEKNKTKSKERNISQLPWFLGIPVLLYWIPGKLGESLPFREIFHYTAVSWFTGDAWIMKTCQELSCFLARRWCGQGGRSILTSKPSGCSENLCWNELLPGCSEPRSIVSFIAPKVMVAAEKTGKK